MPLSLVSKEHYLLKHYPAFLSGVFLFKLIQVMIIDNIFKLGDKVYLVTDVDQKLRIVTGFLIRDNGIMYEVACGMECKWFCGFEISVEKNVLLSTSN